MAAEPAITVPADAGASPRSRRRIAAVLLSIVAPGVGHFAIGHVRRACVFFLVCLGAGAAAVLAALRASPYGMWVGVATMAFVGFFVAPLDTLRRARPSRLPHLITVAVVAVAVLLVWNVAPRYVRLELIEAFQMPSASMYPTLEVGDHVMVDKRARRYERGDVVVFRYPKDPEVTYLKRIVALGGDTIEERNGKLIVNGQPVEQAPAALTCVPSPRSDACTISRETLDGRSYLVAYDDGLPLASSPEGTVPDGHYFVVGDNRHNSNDSRSWGTVPARLLVGKVLFVFWSRGEAGLRWERWNRPVE